MKIGNIEIENGISRIHNFIDASTDFTSFSICLDEKMKGSVTDMNLRIISDGLCVNVPEGNAYFKNFRIESDPSCGL